MKKETFTLCQYEDTEYKDQFGCTHKGRKAINAVSVSITSRTTQGTRRISIAISEDEREFIQDFDSWGDGINAAHEWRERVSWVPYWPLEKYSVYGPTVNYTTALTVLLRDVPPNSQKSISYDDIVRWTDGTSISDT